MFRLIACFVLLLCISRSAVSQDINLENPVRKYISSEIMEAIKGEVGMYTVHEFYASGARYAFITQEIGSGLPVKIGYVYLKTRDSWHLLLFISSPSDEMKVSIDDAYIKIMRKKELMASIRIKEF